MNFLKNNVSTLIIPLIILNSFGFTPKRVGVFYFKENFGIIHEQEDKDSPSQKVIKCGYSGDPNSAGYWYIATLLL